MSKNLARELINAGVHFGHGVSRWNPKMDPYIYGKRGNIHIIDVKKTLKGMLIAKKLLAEIVASNADVVFVGTKRQAQKAVEAAAAKCQMHYVSERWLGGMLTNFRTIRSRLQRLEQLESMEMSGTLEKESKKQASRLKREMKKISTNLNGVRKMGRLPGVMVIVDAKKEYLACREAQKLEIPTIGILDTDSDPDEVDVAIPANDDSIKAIELILAELADAVAVGKTLAPVRAAAVQASTGTRRTRSRRQVLARADQERTVPKRRPPSVSEAKSESPQSDPIPVEQASENRTPAVEEPVPSVTNEEPVSTVSETPSQRDTTETNEAS